MKAPRDSSGKPLPPPASLPFVVCFWIDPHDSVEVSLRRYASGSKCGGSAGIHDASVTIEIRNDLLPQDTLYSEHRDADEAEREDSRWPAECGCGYAFAPEDAWQRNIARRYVRRDTGAVFTMNAAPPGAMWDATWWPLDTPDGRVLVVRLPDGIDWMIDGPATNGRGWTRSGTPPAITARPSILTTGYHGWLTDGVLRSC